MVLDLLEQSPQGEDRVYCTSEVLPIGDLEVEEQNLKQGDHL